MRSFTPIALIISGTVTNQGYYVQQRLGLDQMRLVVLDIVTLSSSYLLGNWHQTYLYDELGVIQKPGYKVEIFFY